MLELSVVYVSVTETRKYFQNFILSRVRNIVKGAGRNDVNEKQSSLNNLHCPN